MNKTQQQERGRNRLDRFQVGCETCGFLAGYPTWPEALEYAREAATRHAGQNEKVRVFDTMAHHDAPHLWDIHGGILEERA